MFGERHLYGIPYFGEDTEKVWDTALKTGKSKKKAYKSLMEFIREEATENKLVIIDGEYLTYLRDIRFNYRDKEILIPYYSYQTFPIDKTRRKRDGHLLLDERNNVILRYNYELRKKVISRGDGREDKEEDWILQLYDINSEEHIETVIQHKFYGDDTFSMEELYNRYINACYMQEDYYLNSHVEGYHVITKNIRGITNKERVLRKEFGLEDYKNGTEKVELNYRDVRQYREEDIEVKMGLVENKDNYWKRILDFESMLYCIMREEVEPKETELLQEWRKLGVSKDIYKYGDDIKLIFKSYWRNNYRPIKLRSWSRVGEHEV